jgi:hypothetical protein
MYVANTLINNSFNYYYYGKLVHKPPLLPCVVSDSTSDLSIVLSNLHSHHPGSALSRVSVLYQYCTSLVPVLYQSCTSIVPVLYQSCISLYSVERSKELRRPPSLPRSSGCILMGAKGWISCTELCAGCAAESVLDESRSVCLVSLSGSPVHTYAHTEKIG